MAKDKTKYLINEVIRHLANLGFTVTPRQLRLWSNHGFFGTIKNNSGYREFSYEDIEKVILIIGLKTLGVSLEKIEIILPFLTSTEKLSEMLKKKPESYVTKYPDTQNPNKDQWYLKKELRDMFKDTEMSLQRTKEGLRRFEELFSQAHINIGKAVLEYQKLSKR